MMQFNFETMRQQFYAWHSGQDSPLYAAASSGLVDNLTLLQLEIRDNAAYLMSEPCNAKFPKDKITLGNKREAAYLRRVADALPELLSLPFTHSFDGRVYRALPWAKEKPTFVNVTVRRYKQDKQPGLFFYAEWELQCYFHIGQHSGASVAYMRDCTTPASVTDDDCAALIREWNNQGPVGTYARIVKRLKRGE